MSGTLRRTRPAAARGWWWVAFSLLVALHGAHAEARAGEARPEASSEARAEAKTAVDKAQLDYTLGRFQQALDGYTHAYEIYEAPALLFNIGQCHRNLGNHERAIFFFDGYLRAETKPNRDKRKLAEDLIAESKGELQRQRAAADARIARSAAQDRAAATAPALAVAPHSPAPPAVSLESAAAAAAPARASTRHNRWLWGTVAVAAAVAAGAAAAYYMTGDPRVVPPTGSVGTLDRH